MPTQQQPDRDETTQHFTLEAEAVRITNPFKPGDSVICVHPLDSFITRGTSYVIDYIKGITVFVNDDKGDKEGFYHSRFCAEAKQQPNPTPKPHGFVICHRTPDAGYFLLVGKEYEYNDFMDSEAYGPQWFLQDERGMWGWWTSRYLVEPKMVEAQDVARVDKPSTPPIYEHQNCGFGKAKDGPESIPVLPEVPVDHRVFNAINAMQHTSNGRPHDYEDVAKQENRKGK